MSRIELNQHNLDKLANKLVRDAAKDTQRSLDRVYSSYHGASVDQIERALQRELRNGPVDYGKPTVRGWAKLFADNTRIQLRTT